MQHASSREWFAGGASVRAGAPVTYGDRPCQVRPFQGALRPHLAAQRLPGGYCLLASALSLGVVHGAGWGPAAGTDAWGRVPQAPGPCRGGRAGARREGRTGLGGAWRVSRPPRARALCPAVFGDGEARMTPPAPRLEPADGAGARRPVTAARGTRRALPSAAHVSSARLKPALPQRRPPGPHSGRIKWPWVKSRVDSVPSGPCSQSLDHWRECRQTLEPALGGVPGRRVHSHGATAHPGHLGWHCHGPCSQARAEAWRSGRAQGLPEARDRRSGPDARLPAHPGAPHPEFPQPGAGLAPQAVAQLQ